MKRILIISMLLVVTLACKRESVDYLGPAYISAPEGFTVTGFTATPSPINFTTNTVIFNAVFTSNVTWTLTITGQTSGAVKKYTNISNGLNNLEWIGTHDGLTFFRTGETAVATLSFFGTTYAPSISIVITQARNFKLYGQFPLAGDFEDPTLVEPQPTPPYYSPYWASFNYPTPIPNVEQGVASNAIDYHGNPVPSVEGSRYYYIRGKGNQSNFVSGLQYFAALNPTLPATPDNIWVNMYLYGTGDANATVELEYQEDDKLTGPGYNGMVDDAFVAYVTLNHIGWKLFSFKYSDLTPSKNKDFGGSGNKIHEPNRLKSFDIVVVKASLPDSPIEVYYDFPIITVGGPFDPSK
jgi:hypothetical protein